VKNFVFPGHEAPFFMTLRVRSFTVNLAQKNKIAIKKMPATPAFSQTYLFVFSFIFVLHDIEALKRSADDFAHVHHGFAGTQSGSHFLARGLEVGF